MTQERCPDIAEQALERGADAFAAVQALLGKIAPFALDYVAVIAEGNSAAVPAHAVCSLVSAVRNQHGLSAPVSGHVKSSNGPKATCPHSLLR